MVGHRSFDGNFNCKVSHFLDENGNWNMELLRDKLDINMLNYVTTTPKSIEEHTKDEPIWGYASNGKFSTASAYDNITKIFMHSLPIDSIWTIIWKLKLPNKVEHFVWLVSHEMILTNFVRFQRRLTDDPIFEWCFIYCENTFHVLRDCSKAKRVWQFFVNPDNEFLWDNFDMSNWIKGNVKNDNHYVNGIPWVVLFCSTMWYIWKCINEEIFSGKKSEPSFIVHQCNARDIMESFQLFPTVNQQNMGQQIMINWSFPHVGVIKSNTDGSLIASSARANYGGVFRDDKGKWMLGYYGFIGNTSILNAEMWSIHQGLKDRNWSNLLIEIDSEAAVQLLKSEKEERIIRWEC